MESTLQGTAPVSNKTPTRSARPVNSLEEHDIERHDDPGKRLTPTDHAEEQLSLEVKSQRQEQHRSLRVWGLRYKKTISTILGLYLLALLCSIAHYIFFDQLDGSIASGDRARIFQSYTTAISLLLVTLFKASLLGSVGVCSAQHLWLVFRGRPQAIAKIESLFQMRHNPLELANPRLILSVSFVLAAYTWIVPFAAIYPPGAMTITSQPFPRIIDVPLSVPQVTFGSDFDPLRPANVSHLAHFDPAIHQYLDNKEGKLMPDQITITTSLGPRRHLPFLRQFSKLTAAAGEIAQFAMPLGENSSYTLDFLGPQVSCRRVGQFNHTSIRNSAFTLSDQLVFADLELGEPGKARTRIVVEPGAAWQIKQHKMFATTGCEDSNGNVLIWDKNGKLDKGSTYKEFVIETTETNCTERYVAYTANITFIKGVRSINYTAATLDPQPAINLTHKVVWQASSKGAKFDSITDRWLDGGGDIAFRASPSYPRFKEASKQLFREWNVYSIYTAFLEAITSVTRRKCRDIGQRKCTAEWARPNGTIAGTNPVECEYFDNGTTTLLEDSRLNPDRFSPSESRIGPTSTLDITESSLNELLTNITFSLVSMQLFTDNITVNATEYLNTYDFSRPINLVLPYALCLGAGALIVALGLWAMWQNGVPATEGFVQVMMATRGRTEMEKLVLEQGLVYPDVASRELKELKVRYGELVGEDDGGERVWGFGTAEETVGLRKRK